MSIDETEAGRAQRAKAIAGAEASAAHEFGEDFDPGEAYRAARDQVIAGTLSFDQAKERLLARARELAKG